MAEVGECSASKPSREIWAKLEPSDSRFADVDISSNEVVICSEITSSSSDKHEWCKITRNSDLHSAKMQNKSSNAILVDDTIVQNEEVVDIKCGTEIIPGPDREVLLLFHYHAATMCNSCPLVASSTSVVYECGNGCFSEWLRRSQEKRSTVLCPHCRAVVQFVGRNHYLHNIEQSILQAHSSLRRSDEEVALLDSYAYIKSNLVIRNGKKHRRKRAHSPIDEESDSNELPCPQCGTEINGFHCNQTTVHLQCQGCGGMMPSRNDSVPQHCLGCDRAFCGAYWHAQMVARSDSQPMCSHETFKPISERTISRIPFLAHEMNRHEQDVTERCIRQMGRSLQDVISDWVEKLNNREIDRTRMPLNHAEAITARSHICNECYDKLVSFLLYWFRIAMPKHLLPADAKQREDCWYGYACRTQHHNEEHARKRNHVCRPTRGSNM
ncbi:RING-type domain-containing protein [Citrus sinensis]|uniref:RING-type domain-containing protein n=1 Tax=Citrus sinensis TaxID=2711 RepID=A0ACB8J5R7_CITSI|nr:RING-type domain-containing protein [Citrus sinensis]